MQGGSDRTRSPLAEPRAVVPVVACTLQHHRESPARNGVMLTKQTSRVAVTALMLWGSASAFAQTADYQTFFTFSGPVTLPGVTLPAGRYLFRLADATTSRRVINVLTADGRDSLAMLTSIPSRLSKAPSEPEVRFMETSADVPPPIKTWW